jgi:N-formylglutamate deformylase
LTEAVKLFCWTLFIAFYRLVLSCFAWQGACFLINLVESLPNPQSKINYTKLNNQLILHIPHASTHFPHMAGFVVDSEVLEAEVLKLTDWYTDDLFFSSEDDMVKAEFSRVFCDVERFVDDSQEVMAQYGMGVLYEKSDAGETIRMLTPELRNKLLAEFYWKHHERLNNAVNNQLKLYGKALIVDCHSFPNTPFKRDLDKTANRPDFNIGTDPYHTPKYLIDLSVAFFERSGYTIGIDWPYKGSIVPQEHYQKNKNVESIMLEINRSLYMQDPNNDILENYIIVKEIIQDYIYAIKDTIRT